MSQLAYFGESQINYLENKVKALEERSKDLEASFVYASQLQQAVLPNERLFKQAFDDAFVLYQPKDIVSGDFYWIYENNEFLYFAVGDCTGHGIPGAILNIAGNTILRQIVKNNEVVKPSEIVKCLDVELSLLFNENMTSGNTRDGMDLALCALNKFDNTLLYCGAGRPLVVVREGEVLEYKSGNNSVGYLENVNKYFEEQVINLQYGDQLYLFSDGYTDQFGGENIKKFNRNRFRKLLSSISEMDMNKQRKELGLAFENWKGNQVQIDDVCVIGLKL